VFVNYFVDNIFNDLTATKGFSPDMWPLNIDNAASHFICIGGRNGKRRAIGEHSKCSYFIVGLSVIN
jgi:hypothetical protein